MNQALLREVRDDKMDIVRLNEGMFERLVVKEDQSSKVAKIEKRLVGTWTRYLLHGGAG